MKLELKRFSNISCFFFLPRWLPPLWRPFLVLPLLLLLLRHPLFIHGSDALRHLPPRLQLPQQPALAHAHSHSGQALRLSLLQPALQPVVHSAQPRAPTHRRAALQVPRVPERVLPAGGPPGAPEERTAQTSGCRSRCVLPGVPSSPTNDSRTPPDAPGAPHPNHGAMMTETLEGLPGRTTLHFRLEPIRAKGAQWKENTSRGDGESISRLICFCVFLFVRNHALIFVFWEMKEREKRQPIFRFYIICYQWFCA